MQTISDKLLLLDERLKKLVNLHTALKVNSEALVAENQQLKLLINEQQDIINQLKEKNEADSIKETSLKREELKREIGIIIEDVNQCIQLLNIK